MTSVNNSSIDFWKGRRVAITGHTGFKGSWLTLWLLSLGAEILGISLDDRKPEDLFVAAGISKNCHEFLCDISNEGIWKAGLIDFQPEVLFHLAAQSLVRVSYENPLSTFRVNVMGTAQVLEASRSIESLQTIIVVTTDKVYRDVQLRQPFVENDHLGGHDPYSASKSAAEIVTSSYVQSFFQSSNVGVSTCRAGNVIGGGDWATNRLIPDAIRAWKRNIPAQVRNPAAVRPWQHVLEPLWGYMTVAELSFENYELATSYNFGPRNSDEVTVAEIMDIAVASYGDVSYSVLEDANSPHESEWIALNSNLARDNLGVEPLLQHYEAVEWTIDWYRKYLSGQDARNLCLDQISEYQRLIP